MKETKKTGFQTQNDTNESNFYPKTREEAIVLWRSQKKYCDGLKLELQNEENYANNIIAELTELLNNRDELLQSKAYYTAKLKKSSRKSPLYPSIVELLEEKIFCPDKKEDIIFAIYDNPKWKVHMDQIQHLRIKLANLILPIHSREQDLSVFSVNIRMTSSKLRECENTLHEISRYIYDTYGSSAFETETEPAKEKTFQLTSRYQPWKVTVETDKNKK